MLYILHLRSEIRSVFMGRMFQRVRADTSVQFLIQIIITSEVFTSRPSSSNSKHLLLSSQNIKGYKMQTREAFSLFATIIRCNKNKRKKKGINQILMCTISSLSPQCRVVKMLLCCY